MVLKIRLRLEKTTKFLFANVIFILFPGKKEKDEKKKKKKNEGSEKRKSAGKDNNNKNKKDKNVCSGNWLKENSSFCSNRLTILIQCKLSLVIWMC